MDLSKLDKNEISVLYYRCQGLPISQIALKLNFNDSEIYRIQARALEKLEIEGQGREKFNNFQQEGCAELGKLTEEDINNWDKRKVETTQTPRTPNYLLYGIIFLAVVGIIWLATRQRTFQPEPTPLALITNTPRPTPEPPEPSPFPTLTEVVAIIPTLTLEIPTATLIPTDTPTIEPSPTLDPATLGLGDAFSDNRVSLLLTEQLKFNQEYYGSSAVWFYFEFENFSGQDILLSYNPADFSLKDNLDRDYECWYILRMPNAVKDKQIETTVKTGSTYKFTLGCGRGVELDSGATTLILTADKFSSLPEMVWTIEVPR